MENKQYTITLSDYMKKYQADNDIKTKITSVELLDKKQLKNKRPKFIITTDAKAYVGTEDEQYYSRIIACDRREDKFVVPRGWGQMTGAVYRRNLNHKKNLSREENKMKLRVWNAINIGSGRIDYYNVDSVKKAKGLINTLADIQLKSENIESNAFGLEEFIDGHWCEWYDEEGYSIDELGTLEDFVVGNYVVDDYYYMTKISELDDTNAYGSVGYDIYRKEIMGIPFNSPIKLLRRATEKEIEIYKEFILGE